MYYQDFKTTFNKRTKAKKGKTQNTTFTSKNLLGALNKRLRSSTLHGLKHIGNPSLPLVERVFWLVIVSLSIYECFELIMELFLDGCQHRTEMSLEPISTQIWDIPFPAVMICSAYPVRKSVFNLEKPSDNKTKYTYYSKMVCPAKDYFAGKIFNEKLDEEFFEFINKAAIPCEDLMVKCTWARKEKNCCNLFKPIITPLGQCYVFNMLPGNLLYKAYSPPFGFIDSYIDGLLHWDVNNGYPDREEKLWKNVYPLWAERSGDSEGLIVDLKDNREEWQETCSGGASGYEVKVFSPLENPETVSGIKLGNKAHTHIALSPSLIISQPGVKSVNRIRRGCVFQDEIPLSYLNFYSRSTCLSDCFVNNALVHCHCVPFDLQRLTGSMNLEYCTDAKLDCIEDLMEQLSKNQTTSKDVVNCNCIPLCSSLKFSYQSSPLPIVTSQTKPPWAKDYNSSSEQYIARVSVYFSEQQFTAISRQVTSTYGDFMSNAGGLLGLMLGFSFVSAFEVIYFLIIRPTIAVLNYFIKKK